MDLKVIFSVFSVVFLAEIGDKTQMATLACASCEPSRASVFIGSSAALITAAAIATLFGGVIHNYIPAFVIKKAAGVMFVAFGVYYMFKP